MYSECRVILPKKEHGGFAHMKPISLPKDIKRYVRKTILLRLLKFVILSAISSFLIYFLNDRIMERCHILVYTGLLVGLGIMPFWVSEIPMKLFDSSWRGIVKAVDIKEETGTVTVSTRVIPYTNHIFILTVEKENGKIVKVKAKEYGYKRYKGSKVPHAGDIQHHLNDYKEGDTVYHFYGLTELFVIGKNRPMNVNCVVCGSENPRTSTHCHHCGHTLLHTILNNDTPLDQGGSS